MIVCAIIILACYVQWGFEMSGDNMVRIAVIIANMDMEYGRELLRGIMEEAGRNRCDTYVFNAYTCSEETVKHNKGQYNIYTLANFSEFDGVIVFANYLQESDVYSDILQRLQETDIPVVAIDADMGEYYSVGVDNYRSMKSIVEHFIEHHHFTKINYVGASNGYNDTQLRQNAYYDALREHGIPVEEKRVFWEDFRYQENQDQLLQMVIDPKERPQAMVCANDGMAVALITWLNEQGIKVPEQIAVSGFDNIAEARDSRPRLTTVARELDAVGREAVHKIVSHLAGEQTERKTMYPANPIFADSCGCRYEEEETMEEVRQRYLKLVDSHERYLAEINTMVEDLNDSKDFREFLTHLKQYVRGLECDRFYLCLNRDMMEELQNRGETEKTLERRLVNQYGNRLRTEGYAPVMSVALSYEFGAFVEYDDFPSGQMLPWQKGTPGGGHTFVLVPVHFRDVCLGYIVVENSEYALKSSLFRLWLINLGNGLENLRKQSELKYMFSCLDRLYVTDQLTELYNRFGFTRYTAESYEACIREHKQFMVLFVDLDGLKSINDIHGHDKGDEAIRTVADALKDARAYDEICARYGGDEYVVYAADYDREKAEAYCKRFEEALIRYNLMLGEDFAINASYGYELHIPSKGELLEKYIDKADKKMYIQKKIKYANGEEEDI